MNILMLELIGLFRIFQRLMVFRFSLIVIELNTIKKNIGNKIMQTNIFRIKANNSIMCGYFCTGLIDFMFADKNFIEYTSLFLPYHF